MKSRLRSSEKTTPGTGWMTQTCVKICTGVQIDSRRGSSANSSTTGVCRKFSRTANSTNRPTNVISSARTNGVSGGRRNTGDLGSGDVEIDRIDGERPRLVDREQGQL